MSAFKFIGYYDRISEQIYAKKDKLDDNNFYSVYYAKNRHDYLFLYEDRMRIPTDHERQIIDIYMMKKDVHKKDNMVKVGVTFAGITLLAFLKWVVSVCDVSTSNIAVNPKQYEVDVELSHRNFIVTETTIKNKLIDMLNNAEVDVEDKNYRMLYYLYYVTYLENGNGDDFLTYLVSKTSDSNYITYHDLWRFYIDDYFNYANIIKTPEEDANKVTYENMDIFLELNMLLFEETIEGNIDVLDYEEYILNFGNSLKERDKDLYRVWAYQVERTSMIGKLVNLKLNIYEKTLELMD